MQLRVKKEIVNGISKAYIYVEDISQEEQDLFDKYGEPLIDLGGTVEKTYIVAPTLTSPDDEEENISINVTLEWDAIEDAESYIVEIAQDANFNVSDTHTVYTNSYTATLLNEITYYWRVAATDSVGTGEWSESRFFRTISVVPNIPTLLTPTNASTDVVLNTEFTWSGQSYLYNPITYDIEISIDNSFITVVDSFINLTEPQFISSNLGNITQYYWRVRAKNIVGDSDWSDVFSFITIIPAPEPPVLNTPVDGELNGLTHQDFSWENSVYAITYHIQISTAIDFSSTYIDQDNLIASSYTVPDDFILTDGNTYYWRVRALGSQGYSNWSDIRTLTIDEDTLPTTPTLSEPSDTSTTINAIIDFTWNVSVNSTSYDIQIATDVGFTSIILSSTGLTKTYYTNTVGLTDATTYYWRVRGTNIDGSSSYSTPFSFTVNQDFNPSHLGLSVLGLWCKSDEGITLSGSKITQWDDLSGNNNHLTQTTDALRMTKSKVLGQTPHIDTTALLYFNVPTNVFTGLTECEMFIIMYPAGASNGAWDLGSSAEATHITYAGTLYDEAFTTVRKNTGSPILALNNLWIYNVVSKSGEWTNRINGTQQYTTATNTVGFAAAPRIGWSTSTYGFNGYYQEILIFKRTLTVTERANMLLYCKTKYGVT